MRVSFDVPDTLWWQLADTDIAGIVVGALRRAAGRPEDLVSSVTRLHHEGLCDADIGSRLGMTSGAVAESRRALGLPANRRFVRKSVSGVLEKGKK